MIIFLLLLCILLHQLIDKDIKNGASGYNNKEYMQPLRLGFRQTLKLAFSSVVLIVEDKQFSAMCCILSLIPSLDAYLTKRRKQCVYVGDKNSEKNSEKTVKKQ